MAEITIDELKEMIKNHPEYYKKWEKGTSVDEALYIKFGTIPNEENINSITYEALDGSEIILDKNKSKIICGIEII